MPSHSSTTLLGEEIDSLKGMAQVAPDVFRTLRILLCAMSEGDVRLADGMRWVLDRVDAAGAPEFEECRPLLRRLLGEMACRTGAAFLTETCFDAEKARWAFAYALTWLRVAGADSVLPPWVRRHNPLVGPLLARLRDVPCDSTDCAYCRTMHNPEALLKRFFGFDEFRATPPDASGGSLQRAIVLAGLRNESQLAILPTGGGKSLCFQLPALARNRRDLAWIRTTAEAADIPVSWPLDRNKTPPPLLFREVRALLRALDSERHTTQTASELQHRFEPEDGGLIHELLAAWAVETGDAPAPVDSCIEFLYETLAQRRRDEHFGMGVALSTVHAAKGMEYPHVLLCGDWSAGARDSLEEERRVLYVGMTRARQTLSLFVRADCINPFAADFAGPCFAPRRETLREVVGDG